MTDRVTVLNDYRPHATAYVVCMDCAWDWVAVFPPSAAMQLECPSCGAMAAEPVDYQNTDWFARFMAGHKKNQERRTLVLLNAARMSNV